jgi:hypothetical protein
VLPLQKNLCEKILTLQHDDDWYKEVKGFIRQNTMMVPQCEGFSFDSNGLLRFKNQIYVLPHDELRMLILSKAHRAVYMAHPGVTKMREDLKPLFFWRGRKADIVNYVARCLECQQVRLNIDTQQDYYNHMPFQNRNGNLFRWILLLDCH